MKVTVPYQSKRWPTNRLKPSKVPEIRFTEGSVGCVQVASAARPAVEVALKGALTFTPWPTLVTV